MASQIMNLKKESQHFEAMEKLFQNCPSPEENCETVSQEKQNETV